MTWSVGFECMMMMMDMVFLRMWLVLFVCSLSRSRSRAGAVSVYLMPKLLYPSHDVLDSFLVNLKEED